MSDRLGQENLPYLLQRAENPVNRSPWNLKPFEEARHTDRSVCRGGPLLRAGCGQRWDCGKVFHAGLR